MFQNEHPEIRLIPINMSNGVARMYAHVTGTADMRGPVDAAGQRQCRKVHADGMRWVYTGDLGYMDEDGFVYFRGRIKRMIVSSGYNIYPAEMENILD